MSQSTSAPRLARAGTVAAGVWSLATAGMGVSWAVGLPGFPFGDNDKRAQEVGSVLATVDAVSAGTAVAVIGAVAALVSVAVSRGYRPTWILATCWLMSGGLLLVVPDIRVIQNFAYLFFGITRLWDWPLLFMMWSMLGGTLWAIVAASIRHGRGEHAASRATTAVTGWLCQHRKGITYLAALLAMPYPVVRMAWALGVPLGVPASYVEDASAALRIGESLLGGLAVGGGVLTIGLVRPWGTIFPRWIPVVRDRPVPVWVAVVPAALAAVLIVQAGLRVLGWTITETASITADTWGMGAPGLFWLPWGIALGAATLGYAKYRRSNPVALRRSTDG